MGSDPTPDKNRSALDEMIETEEATLVSSALNKLGDPCRQTIAPVLLGGAFDGRDCEADGFCQCGYSQVKEVSVQEDIGKSIEGTSIKP